MHTVLLAADDEALRSASKACLEQTGYGVVLIRRPLAVLTLANVVHWDVAIVDRGPLGKGTLEALSLRRPGRLVGMGFEDDRLSASVGLPLVGDALISTLESLLFAGEGAAEADLRLNPLRRTASLGSRDVYLTRTEFRLLQLLHERSPGDVTLPEVLLSVWGTTEGQATSELVRAHLRNLRRKLQQIGLADVIRSRRGRGYSLEL